MEKLKAVRSGHRKVISRLIDRTNHKIEDCSVHRHELQSAIQNIIQKQELLQKIDSEILDLTDVENVEQEIVESEEFHQLIDVSIRHYKEIEVKTYLTNEPGPSFCGSCVSIENHNDNKLEDHSKLDDNTDNGTVSKESEEKEDTNYSESVNNTNQDGANREEKGQNKVGENLNGSRGKHEVEDTHLEEVDDTKQEVVNKEEKDQSKLDDNTDDIVTGSRERAKSEELHLLEEVNDKKQNIDKKDPRKLNDNTDDDTVSRESDEKEDTNYPENVNNTNQEGVNREEKDQHKVDANTNGSKENEGKEDIHSVELDDTKQEVGKAEEKDQRKLDDNNDDNVTVLRESEEKEDTNYSENINDTNQEGVNTEDKVQNNVDENSNGSTRNEEIEDTHSEEVKDTKQEVANEGEIDQSKFDEENVTVLRESEEKEDPEKVKDTKQYAGNKEDKDQSILDDNTGENGTVSSESEEKEDTSYLQNVNDTMQDCVNREEKDQTKVDENTNGSRGDEEKEDTHSDTKKEAVNAQDKDQTKEEENTIGSSENVEGKKETHSQEEDDTKQEAVYASEKDQSNVDENSNGSEKEKEDTQSDGDNTTQDDDNKEEKDTNKCEENYNDGYDVTRQLGAISQLEDESKKILKDNTIQEGPTEEETKSITDKVQCVGNENESEFERFLERFNLGQFYPNKLKLMDVMAVKDCTNPLEMNTIALHIAMKLIMINYTARDELLHRLIEQLEVEIENPNNEISLDLICGEGDDYDESMSANPLDLILTIFKCSAPMLQQVLAVKMFECKLAIPFLHPPFKKEPEILTLWPLRSILIECKNENGSLEHVSVDCPCHVVSFVRLGRPSVSKSKMINEILSDQYHNTFFNKDCPLGTSTRELSEGMVEAAWSLPSKKAQHFKCVTMFLNLRGDGKEFTPMSRNLSLISNVLVVFVHIDLLSDDRSKEIIRSLFSSQSRILFAIDAGMQKLPETKKKVLSFSQKITDFCHQPKCILVAYNGQMRSIGQIRIDFRKAISILANESDLKELALSKRVEQYKGYVDEQKTLFVRTQSAADEIMIHIKSHETNVKTEVVPLQGKTWQTWSEKMKRSNKASLYKTLQEQGKLQCDMLGERRKQAEMCNNLSPAMSLFLKHLQQFVSCEDECLVFVLFLKQKLDERSRNTLPGLRLDFRKCSKDLKLARDTNEHSDVIKHLREKLDKSEQCLAGASFGFEHFCREMGQIYECLKEFPPQREDLIQLKDCLPHLAARLLQNGLPFEIMDEDVANVPLHWVTAVLQTLKESIGDRRLLTLSALGIQSSGKSTLLNTMFGLQFVVSAGRCTRGVYLQLVPVSKDKSTFDYLLVIDTEGLRSPEQAHQKHCHDNVHDNELATFVTGLADITIVNVKGENTSEMKDVLQIAVHASLRLKLANERLNLSQSCVFIHQNVPAIDANDKMMQGRQKLVEELDLMTEEAAKQENIADIQSFNQVIEFDSDNNIWYFSDLWRGDPPMAPANPGYSDSVADVRERIVSRISKSRSTYLTITDTLSRITDLWNGIVQDDFVFSFRNSLEVKAYASLEQICQNLSWKLEKQVLVFAQTKARSKLSVAKSQIELETTVSELLIDLRSEVKTEVQQQKQELDAFIEQHSLRDVMIQWVEIRRLKFKTNAETLLINAQKNINNIKDEIMVRNKTADEKTKHKMEINDLAVSLAVRLKGQKPAEEVIREQFNTLWTSWINKLPITQDDDVPIDTQVESTLCEFEFDAAFIRNQKPLLDHCYNNLKKLEDSLNTTNISKGHISKNKLLFEKYGKEEKTDVFVRQTIDVINIIFRKVDNILVGLSTQDIPFDITYVKQILTAVVAGIENHNKHENDEYLFSLSSSFRAMIINHVASYATVFFTRKKEEYDKKHSPKAQMKEYKGTAWKLFKSTVQEKADDVIAVGLFKEVILKAIVEQIDHVLPIDVSDHMFVQFGDGKHGLVKEILVELANDENFDSYFAFIKDPQSYAESWLRKLIQKNIFETTINNEKMFAVLVQKRSLKLFEFIHRSIDSSTKKVCSNISDWIERFVSEINTTGTLALSARMFSHIQNTPIKDIPAFVGLLNQEMLDAKEEFIGSYNKATPTTVQWKENPVSRIMKKLWGCTELCMFCHEPCKEMSPDHWERDKQPHRCVQHRPGGVNGFRHSFTSQLTVYFCNFLVSSDVYTYIMEVTGPYKEYKQHFPSWDILPNANASDYWKWVMCKFKKEFTDKYNALEPDIPENWWLITKQKAIDSLSTVS